MREIFKCDIPKDEFICGNKFIKICDELNVHFSKIDYWKQELEEASKKEKTIFLTHQGDNPVTQEMVESAPSNIKYWFACNCLAKSTNTCKVINIPLGLNNIDLVVSPASKYGKYSSNFSHITDFHENIVSARKFSISLKEKNLAYVNFNINTNIRERRKCLEYFSDKSFATIENPNRTHLEYLKETLCYPFIISPPGNGRDCIRVWESLYLGRIPVILKDAAMDSFKDLPIMFVDSWSEVSEKSLEDFYIDVIQNYKQDKYNFEKITISYWKKIILESLKEE